MLARTAVPTAFALAALHGGAAQTAIPVRTLTPPLGTASIAFGAANLRPLSNGSVFVNDTRWHRLYLFDSTLAKYTIVFDSTSGETNSYGPNISPMIAWRGDTSLMLDLGAQAVLVLDAGGAIVRVVAQPSATNPIGPAAKSDNGGRLIYRGRAAPPAGVGADSVPLVRADLVSRKLDTVATIKIAGGRSDSARGPDGQMTRRILVNPLPSSDDWTVLADGSLAIVRAQDYHVDWVRPDGSRESTAKMPLDWRRLTDAEKQQIVDSVRKQNDAVTASLAASAGRGGDGAAGGARGGGGSGAVASAGRGGGDATRVPLLVGVVSAGDLPDYVPPLRFASLRADLDGNLWIPPVTSVLATPGEIVYDVVNTRGEIFERVRVPAGKTIAGFGKGGVLYLTSGNPQDGFKVERVKVVRK